MDEQLELVRLGRDVDRALRNFNAEMRRGGFRQAPTAAVRLDRLRTVWTDLLALRARIDAQPEDGRAVDAYHERLTVYAELFGHTEHAVDRALARGENPLT